MSLVQDYALNTKKNYFDGFLLLTKSCDFLKKDNPLFSLAIMDMDMYMILNSLKKSKLLEILNCKETKENKLKNVSKKYIPFFILDQTRDYPKEPQIGRYLLATLICSHALTS